MGKCKKSSLSLVLKILILLSKLKKPLVRKVVSLKKLKLKLLAMEKYKYSISSHVIVREYDYEWSTPLFDFPQNRRRRRRMSFNFNFKKLCSNLPLICRSRKKLEMEMDTNINIMGFNLSLLSAAEDHHQIINTSSTEEVDDDYSVSVDERAERFIQSFYEEMRRQSNSHQFIQF